MSSQPVHHGVKALEPPHACAGQRITQGLLDERHARRAAREAQDVHVVMRKATLAQGLAERIDDALHGALGRALELPALDAQVELLTGILEP